MDACTAYGAHEVKVAPERTENDRYVFVLIGVPFLFFKCASTGQFPKGHFQVLKVLGRE